jgi:hypothetical protein
LETEQIKQYLYQDCRRQVQAGGHYVVFEDTTQPNFERNRHNITDQQGLGVIADKKSLGFFLHPSLVVEASTGRCIGYSHVASWSREQDRPDKFGRGYKRLPLEQKESYRWLEAALASRQLLQGAAQVTMVADREADISELFEALAPQPAGGSEPTQGPKTHLLIRSRSDRKLKGSPQKLYQQLQQQPLAGQFSFWLKGDERKHRSGREATIQVRFSQVSLEAKTAGKSLELYAVEARESEESVPAGETPVLWRLLTTHRVDSFQQACQLIHWYTMRWNIEQVFRLLKHKGLNVEMLDLESGKALIQLTLLALLAISKIMLLHLASKQEEPQPVASTFTPEQMACIHQLNKQYEGKTLKQQNPYPADSLQYCYWVIARLGGWKPHEKQAGVVCLMRGYNRFQQLFQGWRLAKEALYKNVS